MNILKKTVISLTSVLTISMVMATEPKLPTISAEELKMAGYDVPSIRLQEYNTYYCIDDSELYGRNDKVINGISKISLAKGVKLRSKPKNLTFLNVGTKYCAYLPNER